MSQCSATTAAYPITSTDQQPWDDTGTRTYKARFELECLSELPAGQPKWQELRDQWGYDYYPRLPSFDDPEDEQVLAQYFDTAPITRPYRDEEREKELERLGYDHRTFALRSIAQRQGQPAFRNALLTAYKRRCAVTDTEVVSVLEAAHIARYRGTHSNRTNNGLLLRADIHTLFDLHRLTITPDFVVAVDPQIDEPYLGLDGAALNLPDKKAHQPVPELLAQHNAECDWL